MSWAVGLHPGMQNTNYSGRFQSEYLLGGKMKPLLSLSAEASDCPPWAICSSSLSASASQWWCICIGRNWNCWHAGMCFFCHGKVKEHSRQVRLEKAWSNTIVCSMHESWISIYNKNVGPPASEDHVITSWHHKRYAAAPRRRHFDFPYLLCL